MRRANSKHCLVSEPALTLHGVTTRIPVSHLSQLTPCWSIGFSHGCDSRARQDKAHYFEVHHLQSRRSIPTNSARTLPSVVYAIHTWFMPALAKRRVGSSWGTTGLDFQKVWSCLSVKKEINESRTRDAGQPLSENSGKPRSPKNKVVVKARACSSWGRLIVRKPSDS